jgi:choline dehydrogenase-like flavoprotein
MKRDHSRSIVVIGSGPGGAVAAATLAESGRDVLLVEEGPDLPLESAPHFSREEILQKYRNAGVNVTMGSAKVAWVEGRCVGGGSEVNRGLYHRIPGEALENWSREFRVQGLSADELDSHYDACEAIARVSRLPGQAPPSSLRLRDGAEALGWKWSEVPRLFAYSSTPGSGSPGVKQSMTTTFLPRFQAAGGQVMADTRVRRLSRAAGRWRIRADTRGPEGRTRTIDISAADVFVACGAVQTPVLLRRSGLRRNIGDTLGFHPMIKVVARFPDDVNVPSELEPVHQVKEFDPRFSLGCSISKRPALALALVDRPELLPEVDRDWRRMAIYYAQSTGGLAKVRPIPYFQDPLVLARNNEADRRDLAMGLRRLAECLFAAGAEAVYPGQPGVPLLRSAADIARLPAVLPAASGGITTMHLFSSCPMGEDPARCATDSFGRVRDADGLFIVDASVLCGPTIVNPQGTVMAVAHRNVLRYLESRRRPATAAAMSPS